MATQRQTSHHRGQGPRSRRTQQHSHRGFAAMDPELHREISARGGHNSHLGSHRGQQDQERERFNFNYRGPREDEFDNRSYDRGQTRSGENYQDYNWDYRNPTSSRRFSDRNEESGRFNERVGGRGYSDQDFAGRGYRSGSFSDRDEDLGDDRFQDRGRSSRERENFDDDYAMQDDRYEYAQRRGGRNSRY